jgi:membrane glycosyltransferase
MELRTTAHLSREAARLALALCALHADAEAMLAQDIHGRPRLRTMPPIARSPMAPRGWPGRKLGPHNHAKATVTPSPDPTGRWTRTATLRRFALVALIVAQSWIATQFMVNILPYNGRQPLEIAILALFAILFAWISTGFWTACAGLLVVALRGDRHAITRTLPADLPSSAVPPDARTAIVMPICNEDVPRVFAGLRATYESLARTGALDRFDFFVLSDTGNPDTRVAEVDGWLRMCRDVGGFARVFYRWRQHHIKRKSGNIADFCRRWGRNYRYMIVLDADSVMSGECLTRLVQLAEANPTSGIIQTPPRACGRDTLFARMQQFSGAAYGPLFTAGIHFWQLGESYYWGHNAIIRIAPFIKHCALGRLPGRGALSGEILSHDFVEAALMRRAGWAVWIAYDLPGSYEGMPPNLIDELARDRRWCRGNLMNFRLFTMRGLHAAHRAVFVSGVMAYISAPLWFAALILATALLAVHTLSEPHYFIEPYQLFPLWPHFHPEWAVSLFSATLVLLFLPKVLAIFLIAARDARAFGSQWRLALSALLEMGLSMLLAPIRMLFHTGFVITALAGSTFRWSSPARDDAQTTWGDALRRHGVHTLIGIGWAALVWWLDPSFLWWLLPVVGALALSIPLSVYTSRASLGRALRRCGLFLIPEEVDPPTEIEATQTHTSQAARCPDVATAIIDPVINAVACANTPARSMPESTLAARGGIVKRALRGGIAALTPVERSRLIRDPTALARLHFLVWTIPEAHPSWLAARSTYEAFRITPTSSAGQDAALAAD